MNRVSVKTTSYIYEYIHCHQKKIHPFIEIQRIHQIFRLKLHFSKTVKKYIPIGLMRGKKPPTRVLDSMFVRWLFAQFMCGGYTEDPVFPRNAKEYSGLIKDFQCILNKKSSTIPIDTHGVIINRIINDLATIWYYWK